mmetsp:Transcript_6874/g.10788  ORF Transcript_6874/g.10788 Transcript_6874/m.10788 type:complete len:514 (+) Transcript_6874:208-1749(+)
MENRTLKKKTTWAPSVPNESIEEGLRSIRSFAAKRNKVAPLPTAYESDENEAANPSKHAVEETEGTIFATGLTSITEGNLDSLFADLKKHGATATPISSSSFLKTTAPASSAKTIRSDQRKSSVNHDSAASISEWDTTSSSHFGARADGQFRSQFHEYVCMFVRHPFLNSFIMFVIFVNIVVIAVETDKGISISGTVVFGSIDVVSLAIYFLEFIIKIYAEPKKYWKNNYNRFDFIILLVSIFNFFQSFMRSLKVISNVKYLRVLRALRALRALRGIAFVSPLQVIVTAIVKTMGSVLNLVLLLFLIMYVFAVMGFYFFGDPDNGDKSAWGTLPACLLTLFDFVTADNWTQFTQTLEKNGLSSIRWFAVCFIFLGHFIFTNLFIGVVLQNLEEATEEEKRIQTKKKQLRFEKKKQILFERQENEVRRLLEVQGSDPTLEGFQLMIKSMASRLRHDDLVPMMHLSCNLVWLETYLASLDYQENAMHKMQQLHFEIARTLAELVERRLEAVSFLR